MTTDGLATALRACAAGLYPLEAGVALLADSGAFLHRPDFAGRFIEHGCSDGTAMAAIDSHIPGHRLRITPGQLRSRPGSPRKVKRLENVHDLPARLGHRSLRPTGQGQSPQTHPHRRDRLHHDTPTSTTATGRTPGRPMATRLENRWPRTWS
jgi:hypothetical protein